jgi:hypothetical protein
MSGSKFSVSRGVVCERVGDELMIVVPGHAEVVKLTGEAADVFLDVQAGKTPHPSATLISELEALGIIETGGMSRRGLIKAGAIGAGAGIAVLAMPGVAAASSGLVDPDSGLRVVEMGEFGLTSGDPIGGQPTYRRVNLGGWFLLDPPISLVIPDGSIGTFRFLGQETVLTVTGFDDFAFFQVSLNPHILVSEFPGNTATITFESLNLVLTHTFE